MLFRSGQNLVSQVPTIKTEIGNYVQYFSKGTKSILKDGKMNLAIMMNRKGDTSEWIGGADKLDSTWMQNNADATYRGYLQQNYKGQGALNINFNVLDLGYAGFMQGAGYPEATLTSYCQSALANKYVLAPTDKLGYMEIFLEMV